MVARCGGFSDAARRLHVVPSVAAKRVSQLEKTVGAQLFTRSTRHISLTEAGYNMQGRAADLMAGFDEVVHFLQRDEGKLAGHIRIMAPTTVTIARLGEIFSSFLQEHPQVTLEIALADKSINPLEEGFDFAISGRSASYEGVIDVPLCAVHPVLCASPHYLMRREALMHPRDLLDHSCLVFKPAGSHWTFQSPGGILNVDVTARLEADDNFTLLQAAKAQCGIAILPLYIARDALNDGSLQVLLPQFPPQEVWFKVYVPRRKQGVVRVKALVEWLIAQTADALHGNAEAESRTESKNQPKGRRKKHL